MDLPAGRTGDRAVRHRGGQLAVVPLGLIRIRVGEIAERPIEPSACPDVGADGQRIRRAARGPRSPLPRVSAAAGRALGLLPGGLPARLVAVGARTLQLSRGIIRAGRFGRVLPGLAGPGFGLGCAGLRVGHRLVPFLAGRGGLLLRGPRLLLGGGLRLPRLSQPRLGLRRRLPRLGLGLLGAGL